MPIAPLPAGTPSSPPKTAAFIQPRIRRPKTPAPSHRRKQPPRLKPSGSGLKPMAKSRHRSPPAWPRPPPNEGHRGLREPRRMSAQAPSGRQRVRLHGPPRINPITTTGPPRPQPNLAPGSPALARRPVAPVTPTPGVQPGQRAPAEGGRRSHRQEPPPGPPEPRPLGRRAAHAPGRRAPCAPNPWRAQHLEPAPGRAKTASPLPPTHRGDSASPADQIRAPRWKPSLAETAPRPTGRAVSCSRPAAAQLELAPLPGLRPCPPSP